MKRLVWGSVAGALLTGQGLAFRVQSRDEPMAQNVTQEELDFKVNCSFNTEWGMPGHLVPCRIERPEHLLVQRHVDPDSTGVLELGGRYGATTCELARKIRNSDKLVAVEPDSGVWSAWQENMESHHCRANLVKGIVGSKNHGGVERNFYGTRADRIRDGVARVRDVEATPWQEVERQFGVKFDTLLIDCEGCVVRFLEENPGLLEQVKTIILEGDMGDYKDSHAPDCKHDCVQYEALIARLEATGFGVVESFREGDVMPRWEFSAAMDHIWHFALKRV